MRCHRAKCRATNQNATSNRAYPAQAANFVRSIDFAGNRTGAARFPITWPTILSLVPADGEPKSRKFVLHGPPVPPGLLLLSLDECRRWHSGHYAWQPPPGGLQENGISLQRGGGSNIRLAREANR